MLGEIVDCTQSIWSCIKMIPSFLSPPFIPGEHGVSRVRPVRFMFVCRKKGVSASLGSDHRETGGDQDAVDVNAEISDTYKFFLKNLEILRTFTKEVDERKGAV